VERIRDGTEGYVPIHICDINIIAFVRMNGGFVLQSMFLRTQAFLHQAYGTIVAQQVSFRLVCPKGHARIGWLDSSCVVICCRVLLCIRKRVAILRPPYWNYV
jgi:hypothetical protein